MLSAKTKLLKPCKVNAILFSRLTIQNFVVLWWLPNAKRQCNVKFSLDILELHKVWSRHPRAT